MSHWEDIEKMRKGQAQREHQSALQNSRLNQQSRIHRERQEEARRKDKERQEQQDAESLRKDQTKLEADERKRKEKDAHYRRTREDKLKDAQLRNAERKQDYQQKLADRQKQELIRVDARNELAQLQHQLTPEELRFVFDDWVAREGIILQSLESELRLRQEDFIESLYRELEARREDYVFTKIIDLIFARLMGSHEATQAETQTILSEEFMNMMNPGSVPIPQPASELPPSPEYSPQPLPKPSSPLITLFAFIGSKLTNR